MKGLALCVVVALSQFSEPREIQEKPPSINQSADDYVGTILYQAGKFSSTHEVLAVVILKGTENESNLTGQKIFDLLNTKFFAGRSEGKPIPTKAFIEQSSGKYTSVSYFVRGIKYGPYGLKNAVENAVVVAKEFDAAFGKPLSKP